MLENSAQIFNALSDIPGEVDDVDKLFEVSYQIAGSLTDMALETHRRKHLAYLMADQGALLNPENAKNLPKQVRFLTFAIHFFSICKKFSFCIVKRLSYKC